MGRNKDIGNKNGSAHINILLLILAILALINIYKFNYRDSGITTAYNDKQTYRYPIETNYQYLNDGDIVIKSAKIYTAYDEEANKDVLYYQLNVQTTEKCVLDAYIHLFDEYKEHLGKQQIYYKFEGSGEFTVNGLIWGYEAWWYPDIYYIGISEYKSYYYKDLMYR